MKLPKFLSRISFLRRTPLQHQLIQTMCSCRKISIPPPPPPPHQRATEIQREGGSKRRQFRGGRVVASRGLCSGSPSKIGELLTAVLFIVSWLPLILLLISVSQQSYCFHLWSFICGQLSAFFTTCTDSSWNTIVIGSWINVRSSICCLGTESIHYLFINLVCSVITEKSQTEALALMYSPTIAR